LRGRRGKAGNFIAARTRWGSYISRVSYNDFPYFPYGGARSGGGIKPTKKTVATPSPGSTESYPLPARAHFSRIKYFRRGRTVLSELPFPDASNRSEVDQTASGAREGGNGVRKVRRGGRGKKKRYHAAARLHAGLIMAVLESGVDTRPLAPTDS